MRPANPNRDKALTAIRAHIEAHGPETVGAVRKLFADVPRGTWHRYVRQVKKELGLSAPREKTASQKGKERKRAKAQQAAPRTATTRPSSKALQHTSESETAGMTMQQRWEVLYSDAEALRRYSVRDDGTIKNPMFFSQSIRWRRELMNTGAQILQQVWNLQRMQRFYDAMLQELRDADPELARRVVQRLEALEAEHASA